MTEEKLNKLWYELEDEEKKAEVEYCKMFNSTPDEVPLNEMVRFRSGYCMGRHYGYLDGLHEGQKENEQLQKQLEEFKEKLGDLQMQKAGEKSDLVWNLMQKNDELKAQNEKLLDFVVERTVCCDVCPNSDTCRNDEGTCPYAGILKENEEKVTREWILKSITKE